MNDSYSILELFEELKNDNTFDPDCEYKDYILDALLINILQ